MIIKASQRSGARNLANHLTNTSDNDHVTVQQIRGLAGKNLHEALCEIEAVAKGTRCRQPLFSVSFNPPINQEVTFETFNHVFAQFEKKLGLVNQPRVVVYHEKQGRRHAHVVWSRINLLEMKAIRMSHFKNKCKTFSRELYLKFGWDVPKGLLSKSNSDAFNVSNPEWQQFKRQNIDLRDIQQICQEAWTQSDDLNSFKLALEEKGLFLCRGDRRGYVLMDYQLKIFSLSRFGGIKKRELTAKLGSPEHLPSLDQTKVKILSICNFDEIKKIQELKKKHEHELYALKEEKNKLVRAQRVQRRELEEQLRKRRKLVLQQKKTRLRANIKRSFNRSTERNKRVSLIKRKHVDSLKKIQTKLRHSMFNQHAKEMLAHHKKVTHLKSNHLIAKSKIFNTPTF